MLDLKTACVLGISYIIYEMSHYVTLAFVSNYVLVFL